MLCVSPQYFGVHMDFGTICVIPKIEIHFLLEASPILFCFSFRKSSILVYQQTMGSVQSVILELLGYRWNIRELALS